MLLQNLLHAQLLNTLGFTLIIWLVYRLLIPNTPMLWYDKIGHNALFIIGLTGLAYSMQFIKGLLTPLFLDATRTEVVTIIEIGERVIDQAEFIVDLPWSELTELKVGPVVTLFSFMKAGQEPVYITVPTRKISAQDRNILRKHTPPLPRFKTVYQQLLRSYRQIPRQLLRQGLFIWGVIAFIEWALV